MPHGTQGQKKLEGEMKQSRPNAGPWEPDGGHRCAPRPCSRACRRSSVDTTKTVCYLPTNSGRLQNASGEYFLVSRRGSGPCGLRVLQAVWSSPKFLQSEEMPTHLTFTLSRHLLSLLWPALGRWRRGRGGDSGGLSWGAPRLSAPGSSQPRQREARRRREPEVCIDLIHIPGQG